MIISCSEHLRKIPFFTKSSFPIKLLTSQKKNCVQKDGLQSQLCYFYTNYDSVLKRFSSGKIILWGKFFFSGKYFHRKNLKRKIMTFPQQVFSNKVPFFYSALAQCINSSKTNGNRPNLNLINQ